MILSKYDKFFYLACIIISIVAILIQIVSIFIDGSWYWYIFFLFTTIAMIQSIYVLWESKKPRAYYGKK